MKMKIVKNLYKVLSEGEGIGKKIFITDGSKKISPWHDINVMTERTGVINMVNEIPKDSKEKMEVATKIAHNPIIHNIVVDKADASQKKIRLLGIFPLFNYGMIPRTWENSTEIDPESGMIGDNDPLDICELGDRVLCKGEIVRVRVLGSFCVADQGEMDWKIISLNERDAEEKGILTFADFEAKYPNKKLAALANWFKTYKIYEGKHENQILYNQKIFDKNKTLDVIKIMEETYEKLRSGKIKNAPTFWFPQIHII